MRWLVRNQRGSRPIGESCRGVVCVTGSSIPRRGHRWFALLLLALSTQSALAQRTSQVPRIGILSPYLASGSSFQDDVKRGLTDLGYVEGSMVAYETRFAEGHTDWLPALAADLVQRKVNVIVTTTAPAVRAAMQATTAIPIVIGGVDDAVEQGFVMSLAKPGGNVTGTSWLNVELIARPGEYPSKRRGIV
jgi:ABC-type uncharacterized transport system substrate-binding protein